MKLEELVPSFETCNKLLENNIEFNESVFVWVKFLDSKEPHLISRNNLLDNKQYEYLCGGPTEGEMVEMLMAFGYCGVEAMYSSSIHEENNHEHDWEILALAPKDNWLIVPQHTYSALRKEAFARILLKVKENEGERKAKNG